MKIRDICSFFSSPKLIGMAACMGAAAAFPFISQVLPILGSGVVAYTTATEVYYWSKRQIERLAPERDYIGTEHDLHDDWNEDELVNRVPHNGDRYEGDYFQGERHGNGTCWFINGDRYEGEYQCGKPHGKGTFYYRIGERYEGDFRQGKRHGKGKFYYLSGNRYEGDFQNNKANGQGICYLTNGDSYVGSSQDGLAHGKGVFYYANGNRYVGDYEHGRRHGRGTFYYVNGNRYVGDYEQGERQGKGTFYYANGDCYEGDFEQGKRHGRGKFFTKKNEVKHQLQGEWLNGYFVGDSSFLSSPYFLYSILRKGSFISLPAAISIICDYFKKKQKYPRVIYAFSSLLEIDHKRLTDATVNEIYTDLMDNNKSRFISLGVLNHVLLLEIEPTKNDLIFNLYNSGNGLKLFHDQDRSSGRYQTRLQFQVPKESVDSVLIKNLIDNTYSDKSVNEFYRFLLALPGAKKIESQNPIWQREQKGKNCTVECVFAYLKNTLGEEEYHHMRLEFFDACIQAIEASDDPQAHLFLDELHQKKLKRAQRVRFGVERKSEE